MPPLQPLCWSPLPTSILCSGGGAAGGMVRRGSQRRGPFFGNICLSWLLSVCHHSSLSQPAEERASGNGEKIGRREERRKGRKEREGGGRRLHPMVFASLLAATAPPPPMRRRGGRGRALAKPTAITGMVKPASLARQMDGAMDG